MCVCVWTLPELVGGGAGVTHYDVAVSTMIHLLLLRPDVDRLLPLRLTPPLLLLEEEEDGV